MAIEPMRSIQENAVVEIEKIKGSRFIGMVFAAKDLETAEKILKDVKKDYADARHWCWAWRGLHADSMRYSDDGEPSGTAGKPMLTVLEGADLSEALGVVVRYFGGTKLGKGGLVRAYTDAVKAAVDACVTVVRIEKVSFKLELDYALEGSARHLLEACEAELDSSEYSASVVWQVTLPAVHKDRLCREFQELTAGRGSIEEVDV